MKAVHQFGQDLHMCSPLIVLAWQIPCPSARVVVPCFKLDPLERILCQINLAEDVRLVSPISNRAFTLRLCFWTPTDKQCQVCDCWRDMKHMQTSHETWTPAVKLFLWKHQICQWHSQIRLMLKTFWKIVVLQKRKTQLSARGLCLCQHLFGFSQLLLSPQNKEPLLHPRVRTWQIYALKFDCFKFYPAQNANAPRSTLAMLRCADPCSGAGRTCHNWHLSLSTAPIRFNLKPGVRGARFWNPNWPDEVKAFILHSLSKWKKNPPVSSIWIHLCVLFWILDVIRSCIVEACESLLLPEENHKEILWTSLKVVMHMT